MTDSGLNDYYSGRSGQFGSHSPSAGFSRPLGAEDREAYDWSKGAYVNRYTGAIADADYWSNMNKSTLNPTPNLNPSSFTSGAPEVPQIGFWQRLFGDNNALNKYQRDMALWQFDKQLRWELNMYDLQKRDQWSMWNATNSYNSPAAQMARFREAGLNPWLIYGKGDSGSAGPIHPPTVDVPNMSVPNAEMGSNNLPGLIGAGVGIVNAATSGANAFFKALGVMATIRNLHQQVIKSQAETDLVSQQLLNAKAENINIMKKGVSLDRANAMDLIKLGRFGKMLDIDMMLKRSQASMQRANALHNLEDMKYLGYKGSLGTALSTAKKAWKDVGPAVKQGFSNIKSKITSSWKNYLRSREKLPWYKKFLY